MSSADKAIFYVLYQIRCWKRCNCWKNKITFFWA